MAEKGLNMKRGLTECMGYRHVKQCLGAAIYYMSDISRGKSLKEMTGYLEPMPSYHSILPT